MNKKLKGVALDILKGRWINIVGVFTLYTTIVIAISAILETILTQYFTENVFIINGIEILLYIIFVPFYFGLIKYCIDFKNNKQKFREIYKFYLDGKLLSKTMVSYLLRLVYVIFKSIFLIIPGIIAIYEYALVEYLIVKKPEIKTEDALNQSKEMMNGNKIKLFSLQLSFFGWYVYSIVLSFILVAISTIFLGVFGVNTDLIDVITVYIYGITLVIEVSAIYVYSTLAKLELFDGIYNKYMGIESSEEVVENQDEKEKNEIKRDKKIKKSIKTVVVITIVILILGSIGMAEEKRNLERFKTEMNKIDECLRTYTLIDMNIYCTNELGDIENYIKNLYEEAIIRELQYSEDYDNANLNNILVPSVLDADKPNMTKSKHKVEMLKALYENLYNDLSSILNINKIKNDMANIKIDETIRSEYVNNMVDTASMYSSYMKKNKELLLKVYDSYYDLIDFLAKNNKEWHAVGDQMYVNDSILSQYNALYNKVIEAEDNYNNY